MDDQVKARLIGATVLVAIAVALVPELLSGPKRAAAPAVEEGRRTTRTHTIDLVTPGSSSVQQDTVTSAPAPMREASRLPVAAAQSPSIPPVAGRSDPPEPSTSSAPAAAAGPAPAEKAAAPVAREPVAPPKPLANETRTTSLSKGGFAVQVGAFGSADAARRLVGQLRQEGLDVHVAPLKRDGKTLHRVRVGPQPTREDANRVAARLKSRGLPATVVVVE